MLPVVKFHVTSQPNVWGETMKSKLVVIFLIIAAALQAAERPRIALSDFTVETDSDKYKFVGKGLSELIGVELLKSRDVMVVERDKRAQLLAEMEFSLSDLADESKTAQIGKLLSADYLAFGSAVQMGDEFLITMKLVEVETGERVWADTIMAPLSSYGRIAAFLTGSMLKSLKVTVAVSTEQKAEVKEEKNPEALIAFSQAVESFDNKDTAAAMEELDKAKKIDPENEAVDYYIAKLSGASPRMQVELDIAAASYNPAMAAFMEKPLVYWWFSATRDMSSEGGAVFGNLEFKERFMTARVGVLLPLPGNFGLMAEVSPFTQLNSGIGSLDHSPIFDDPPGGTANLDRSSVGALLGLSWKPLPQLSLGASFRAAKYFESGESWFSDPIVGEGEFTYHYGLLPGQSFVSFSFEGGLMYKSSDENAGADLRVLYSPDQDGYLDLDARELVLGQMPVAISAGGSYGFLNKSLFIAGRAIAEVYYDERAGIMLRLIPAVEWWPFAFLGMRAGYEFSYLDLLGTSDMGHGGMAGVSAKLFGFSLDFNYTYRYRPYRHLPGYGFNEDFLLIGLTYDF
jgi:TolB-like protein